MKTTQKWQLFVWTLQKIDFMKSNGNIAILCCFSACRIYFLLLILSLTWLLFPYFLFLFNAIFIIRHQLCFMNNYVKIISVYLLFWKYHQRKNVELLLATLYEYIHLFTTCLNQNCTHFKFNKTCITNHPFQFLFCLLSNLKQSMLSLQYLIQIITIRQIWAT